MAEPKRRRRRGEGYSVRQLRSGRWQLRLRDPATGDFYGSGQSYASRAEAEAAGRRMAVEQAEGGWVDPRRGEVTLAEYLTGWLEARRRTGRHGDRYSAEAARLARLHVLPALGHLQLVELRPAVIRRWHDDLVASRLAEGGAVGLVPAKSYRLLSAVLSTAVADELIRSNPCRIEGAGVERTDERPLIEPEQIRQLIEALPERWQAMALTAAWCGLRFGELVGLQRRHVDPLHRIIAVERAVVEVGGRLVVKAPKSRAGRRVVDIPPPLVPVLEAHLARYAEPRPTGYVFVGPKGGLPRRGNWTKVWQRAAREAGLPGVRLHDLRHAAGTMAAQLGATAREIQDRLGHASPAAAHRYQHAAQRRGRELADRLGALMEAGRTGAQLAHGTEAERESRR